jgi:hypothetical protein
LHATVGAEVIELVPWTFTVAPDDGQRGASHLADRHRIAAGRLDVSSPAANLFAHAIETFRGDCHVSKEKYVR